MSEPSDDSSTLSTGEAMRVIDEQTAAAAQSLGYDDRRMYLVWGLAYVVGYLPFALSVGPDAPLALPFAPVLMFFFACMAAGVVSSAVSGARMSRDFRGATQARGRMYGWSWTLALIAAFGLSYRVQAAGVDELNAGMLSNGAFMLVVACLFMAGGVVWRDAAQFVIGALVSITVTVALVAGLPYYYWIMSLGVGGLLLVAAFAHRSAERGVRAWLARRHD